MARAFLEKKKKKNGDVSDEEVAQELLKIPVLEGSSLDDNIQGYMCDPNRPSPGWFHNCGLFTEAIKHLRDCHGRLLATIQAKCPNTKQAGVPVLLKSRETIAKQERDERRKKKAVASAIRRFTGVK